MFSDPIAELLTKLRNGKDAQHRFIDVSFSNLKVRLLEILREHRFIEQFLVNQEQHKIRVFLRYVKNRRSILSGLKRVSTPGWRRYVQVDEIPRVFNGMGIAILSTCKGVVDGETARALNVGGELLCTVW